jgi:16S rRNA (uracil1498-N3)-methyltransferase
MSNKIAKTRLFIDDELKVAAVLLIDQNQGHHLVNVLRLKLTDYITIFNGRSGEWLAEITKVGKGKAMVTVREQIAEQTSGSDLWYIFAPLKKARIDYMMQKATELGVSAICPVLTKRTNLDRLKPEKLLANVVDAAEQCGRMSIPKIDVMTPLTQLLKDWPRDRILIFCDEAGDAMAMQDLPKNNKKWAVLIGPEGGFTAEERQMIRDHENSIAVTLGPRILRADTAAVTVIALWQSFLGDWSK